MAISETGCSDLLTARFRVRVPVPEPNRNPSRVRVVEGRRALSNDTTMGQCNPKVEDIKFSAVGAQSIPDIAWINRPTFQQVVQFPASRLSSG